MDFYEFWTEALKTTEIIRPRVQQLATFEDTAVPYIFLAASAVNPGDSVVRQGEVLVKRPAIFLPPHVPQLEGFELEKEQDFNENNVVNFLLVRGIQLPSLHYSNKTSSLGVFEGNLDQAVAFYLNKLQRQENVHTGLLKGAEETWAYSVFIYICTQVARNAERDIQRLLEEYRKKER